MAYTTHGYHIPGTEKSNAPGYPIRCSGIGSCGQCTKEARIVRDNLKRAVYDKGNNDA